MIADAPKPHPGVDCRTLGELLNVRSDAEELVPSKDYAEPRINTTTHEITTRTIRRGSTIRGKKIVAQEGDLIIGTLHTNNNNGNFAFSDQEYIVASQIVAVVKTDIVSKDYLASALEAILPKMPKDDLVGRETFTKEEILNLEIPMPTAGSLKTKGEQLDLEAETLREKVKKANGIRKELIEDIRSKLHGGLAT